MSRRLAVLGLPTLALAGLALAACDKKAGAGASAATALPADMSLGNPAAKVTVVEYASVACPVCGHWYKDIWPSFKAKYVDTGKVHFIYREMLVGDSDEVTTASAGFLLARCAGPGNYFKIVDAVYNSQPGLFADPRGVLLNIAKSSGMTEAQFDACIRDPAALDALQTRVAANAKKDSVNATPTFVINGKSMDPGFHPLSDLDAAIAAAAAKT